jgi:transcription elongation factor Elf1
MMIYLECKTCGQIESDCNWIDNQDKKECKYCHECDMYKVWPSAEIRTLFETIKNYKDTSSFEYVLISSVFISSALELLLEKLIYIVAFEDRLPEEITHLVELLLEANQGREKRLKLFQKLGYDSIDGHSRDLGYKDFPSHWIQIAKIRNNIIHGKLEGKFNLSPNIVVTTINEAIEVFSKIYNIYNSETIRYKVTVEKFNEDQEIINKELTRLKRWRKMVLNDFD